MYLSIISPVYHAEVVLENLVSEIQKVMNSIDVGYEIILVDDRSPDESWKIMQQLSSKFAHVKSIRLSKNFGENNAIIAGLTYAKGDWVVVMDCDLQDQPKEILKLYEKTKQGYDLVLASRKNRKDGILKKLSSKLFSKVFKFLTDNYYDNSVNNFGIYNKKVIQSVLKMNDTVKFFPLFIKFVGYNSATIEVEHAESSRGKSSYSLSKLINLSFNVFISFSNKPMRYFVKFGGLMILTSLTVGILTIIEHFYYKVPVGYSSLMVSIWFLAGVNVTVMGIIGIYIGKIFNQSKGREAFIIDEIIN